MTASFCMNEAKRLWISDCSVLSSSYQINMPLSSGANRTSYGRTMRYTICPITSINASAYYFCTQGKVDFMSDSYYWAGLE